MAKSSYLQYILRRVVQIARQQAEAGAHYVLGAGGDIPDQGGGHPDHRHDVVFSGWYGTSDQTKKAQDKAEHAHVARYGGQVCCGRYLRLSPEYQNAPRHEDLLARSGGATPAWAGGTQITPTAAHHAKVAGVAGPPKMLYPRPGLSQARRPRRPPADSRDTSLTRKRRTVLRLRVRLVPEVSTPSLASEKVPPRPFLGKTVYGEPCDGKRHFDCIYFVNWCFYQAVGHYIEVETIPGLHRLSEDVAEVRRGGPYEDGDILIRPNVPAWRITSSMRLCKGRQPADHRRSAG